jgi:Fur family ferric uptake transcriptional regulator
MQTNKEQYLIDKNIKITANRLLILDVFLRNNFALSLMDIEKLLPWSDRATIFRTLKTFEKNALIHAIDEAGKSTKYALCSTSCKVSHHSVHPHFHCKKCGRILCLTAQDVPIPELPNNFVSYSYSLIINGLCSSCNVQ